MKRRLMGFKSQYMIFMALIFMVVLVVNIGDSSASNTTNFSSHNDNGMIQQKLSTSTYISNPTNNRTKERFKSIDDAVQSKNTINGDIIIVRGGNYTENIKINKKLILMAFGNVNITAKDPDLPIFSVSKSGSGTMIKGFNFVSNDILVSNAILLNSSRGCSVSNNNFVEIPGIAILIKNSENNTVSFNSFKNGMDGIDLANAKNTIINGNNFNNLTLSMEMSSSTSIKIYNNNITNIGGTDYLLMSKCFNSTISHNNFKATVSSPITSNIIRAIDSENNTISSNYMKTRDMISGIELQNSDSNKLIDNKIKGPGSTGGGIHLLESDNNLIKNNVISSLFFGINLESSLINSVMGNDVFTVAEDGIHLVNCFGTSDHRNIIGYNTISSCLNGIHIELSFHNSIFNNSITNCDTTNIFSINSESNNFYQNHLSNAPISILFKNSDNCKVVSNVITNNSPDTCAIALDNSISTTSRTTRTSKAIIVGSIGVSTLPDIDVHFNRIMCPIGIKNENTVVSVDASQNWWGSNNPNFDKLVSGSVKHSTWIFMTCTTKTQRTIQGTKLAVTTSFNNLYNGKTLISFNPKIGHIPNGTLNFFVTNIGRFEGNYVKKDTSNGQAVTIYCATRMGNALITTTTDNQTLKRNITVEPVLQVLNLKTSSLQHNSLNYGNIKLSLNKPIKNYNSKLIELKPAAKTGNLIPLETRLNGTSLYIYSKTALKKGVTYKLIVHSTSVLDSTGNGLAKTYIKTFKI